MATDTQNTEYLLLFHANAPPWCVILHRLACMFRTSVLPVNDGCSDVLCLNMSLPAVPLSQLAASERMRTHARTNAGGDLRSERALDVTDGSLPCLQEPNSKLQPAAGHIFRPGLFNPFKTEYWQRSYVSRNTESRSRNHCCHGKECVTYS